MGSGGAQQFGGLGGLDDLLGNLTGGRSGGAGGSQGGLGGLAGSGGLASIAMAVISMLMSQRGSSGSGGLGGALGSGGGLGGLLDQLQKGGLGTQTRSWVEPGENESVNASQVREALGDDAVDEVAARAGVSREEAADGLAGLLPQLVDRLTPDGRVPDDDQLRGMLGGLTPK
jgi:uncharacterized protein YidB (DUF937 family)